MLVLFAEQHDMAGEQQQRCYKSLLVQSASTLALCSWQIWSKAAAHARCYGCHFIMVFTSSQPTQTGVQHQETGTHPGVSALGEHVDSAVGAARND